MPNEQNIQINKDDTYLLRPLIVNQAYLRTILETQTKILAHLEDKDPEKVFEELNDSVNENIKFVADTHREQFSEVYKKDNEGEKQN